MFKFNRKEKGQGLVEYALILVLIAIVVIVAMTTLGGEVSGTFDEVNSGLGGGEAATAAPSANYIAPTGNTAQECQILGIASGGTIYAHYNGSEYQLSDSATPPDGYAYDHNATCSY